MPPRARKAAPVKEVPISEAPIILFLKVSKEAQSIKKDEDIPQPFKTTEYSEILKEEIVQQHFNESIIHNIISKIHQQTEDVRLIQQIKCAVCCGPLQPDQVQVTVLACHDFTCALLVS